MPIRPLLLGRRQLVTAGSLAASSLLLAPRMGAAAAKPIAIHPENPRYFLWRGKPRILLGPSETQGAVVNAQADLTGYLDIIARAGSNITRITSGTLIESFYVGGSYLAVAGEHLIAPWARTKEPANLKGGYKLDLTRFDPAYFARLRKFVGEAGKRGIVVMYIFFTQHYEEPHWKASPFHPLNNVNVTGVGEKDVYTLDRHGGLLPIQEKLIKKVVAELRPFDNVIYELTHSRAHYIATPEWERHVLDLLAKTLKAAGDTKLVAQNFGKTGRPDGETIDPRVGVISHTEGEPMVMDLYRDEKRPVGQAETGHQPSSDRDARFRAWDFVLGGAGLYIHSDHAFGPKDPRGERLTTRAEAQFGGGPRQRQQLQALIQIVNQLDFVKMKPAHELVRPTLPPSLRTRVLADPGRSYLIYVRPVSRPKAISARWTGKLVAKRTGEHTLFTTSNDGVRLWLDDKLCVDNWKERAPIEDKATALLEAGKAHDLKIEYFYTDGAAVMRLEWQGPQLARELVPATQLRTPAGESGGLRAEYFTGRAFDRKHLERKDATVDYSAKHAGLFAPPVWTPGPLSLEVEVTEGEYRLDWLDPASGGRYGHWQAVKHPGGPLTLTHPNLVDDIAARLTQVSEKAG